MVRCFSWFPSSLRTILTANIRYRLSIPRLRTILEKEASTFFFWNLKHNTYKTTVAQAWNKKPSILLCLQSNLLGFFWKAYHNDHWLKEVKIREQGHSRIPTREKKKKKTSQKLKESEVAQSCVIATLWTVAYQAPPSTGFSRQEYYSTLPFPSPGDLPQQGMEPRSPALQADALPSEPPGKPHFPEGMPFKTFMIWVFQNISSMRSSLGLWLWGLVTNWKISNKKFLPLVKAFPRYK